MEKSCRDHYREGYKLIGHTDYDGEAPEMSQLKAQAKRVNARVVVFQMKYLGTTSGSTPLVIQNPQQIVTSQTYGNVSGYGGSASYSQNTTTAVPGGYTTYQIPYSFSRYEVHAAFFGKD